MRKKTAYILPFLLLLIGQSAESQIQNNIPDYIRQRFHMYMETVPWEEIYVHSDRNEYISGEDLWFDVYLIDRQSLKPSANSRIAYIELLNAQSRPVLQKRILLVKGFGPGQIRLPDTLSTGTYTIRAYTNWMKNFLPWNCFRKEIKIFNSLNTGNSTLKPPALEAATRSIDTQPRSGPINTDITLVLNNSDSNTLILSVSAGENYLTANGNHFTLVVQTRGNIDLIDSEVLAEGKARITIPRISLISGINQITILDSRLKPVCERYVFNPPGYRPAFNLLSPAAANRREKISLEFDLRDIPALAVNPANLSVSVAAASNTNAAGLDDYLLFGTEFGFIPPDVLNSGGQRGFDVKIIDSIMSDKKSRWIDWDEILSGNLPHFKYQAEK
ncbi:MAG: hypothetical protein Q8868_06280, partial [Bacteroidota bacterium]|nr:hypothetical protein [Bacteroidota bacterium]